jgi:hypothetical protein
MIDRFKLLGALAVFCMTLAAWSAGTGGAVYADSCQPGDYDEFCAGPEMCGGVPPEEYASCYGFCTCYHNCICVYGEPFAPYCSYSCGGV